MASRLTARKELVRVTNTDKVNVAAEKLLEGAQDSYQIVMDHAVGLQERNVLFAQSVVEGSIREFRQQSERNWEMAQELFERAEEQGDAFRRLLKGSISTYMNFLYLPFSYYGRA